MTASSRFPEALRAGWRTRFAPAPTGWLHLGHALNAAIVWGVAAAHGGRVVLRIEDHDTRRSRPEFEDGILDDLHWLGLTPDEVAPPQRDRGARYEEVLSALTARGVAYPCACSRREIAGGTGERHLELVYPGTCRGRALDPGTTRARRVSLAPLEQTFDDLRLGPVRQTPALQCGDLLVRDRDGQWTYQFAVTVDDMDQGINLVIRGEDLLGSTGRQLQLGALIGRVTRPRYLHHALLRHPDGEKLSKSRGDTGVRELRAAGRTPAQIIGEALHRGGLLADATPVDASTLASLFRSGRTASALFAAGGDPDPIEAV